MIVHRSIYLSSMKSEKKIRIWEDSWRINKIKKCKMKPPFGVYARRSNVHYFVTK